MLARKDTPMVRDNKEGHTNERRKQQMGGEKCLENKDFKSPPQL